MTTIGRGNRKSDDERVRRNKPTPTAAEQLPEWDGIRRGPELPDDWGIDWSPGTTRWWDKWRDSPQAMLCADLDWESMYVAAIIHDRICKGVSNTALANLSGELRKREGMFGASPEDRQRLNMTAPSPLAKAKQQEKIIEKEAPRVVNYAERLLTKHTRQTSNPGG